VAYIRLAMEVNIDVSAKFVRSAAQVQLNHVASVSLSNRKLSSAMSMGKVTTYSSLFSHKLFLPRLFISLNLPPEAKKWRRLTSLVSAFVMTCTKTHHGAFDCTAAS
jgi:hypothetical protein